MRPEFQLDGLTNKLHTYCACVFRSSRRALKDNHGCFTAFRHVCHTSDWHFQLIGEQNKGPRRARAVRIAVIKFFPTIKESDYAHTTAEYLTSLPRKWRPQYILYPQN